MENTHSNTSSESVKIAEVVARVVAETAQKLALTVADTNTKSTEAIALIGQDISYIKSDISEMKLSLDNKYVTKQEFSGLQKDTDLVRRIVFGAVSIIVVAVFSALVYLVVAH